jgi:hypothetical protein
MSHAGDVGSIVIRKTTIMTTNPRGEGNLDATVMKKRTTMGTNARGEENPDEMMTRGMSRGMR